MELQDVYNGIVWTESAIDFLRRSPQFLKTAAELNVSTRMQIVLAPSVEKTSKFFEMFQSISPPRVVLALDTSPAEKGVEGFPRYCARTLRDGIRQIRDFARKKSKRAITGNLGALISKAELSIEEAQESRPKDEKGVFWLAVEVQDKIFIGPELPSLAEQILIYYGVDPERTLWLCSVPTEGAKNSVDFRVLLRKNAQEKTRPIHIGPDAVPQVIREWLIGTPFFELAGNDPTHQLEQISRAILYPPIRLHQDCDLLRSKRIFRHLSAFRDQGHVNRDAALSILKTWHQKRFVEPRTRWFQGVSESLAQDGVIFDNKSGAIAFDSYEWENEIKHKGEDYWQKVVQYFEKRLGGQWQSDRPNLARRLETPTKTILRGEEYYINMANVLPIDRIESITANFGDLFKICDLRKLFRGWDEVWKWKLALAICDQLRNCVLQVNWYAYQLDRDRLTKSAKTTESLLPIVLKLTDAAVGLYYSTLLMDRKKARGHLGTLLANHLKLIQSVRDSLKTVKAVAQSIDQDMTFTQRHVRRWREADHPGENLLTAAQAVEFCNQHGTRNPLAVGISWGGIELPLVFKHVWMATQDDLPCPLVLVADYSHYRRNAPTGELPYMALVPGSPGKPVAGSEAIIFDDNSLTGLTIERVHDDLLKRRCKIMGVFITRLSGGRRYGQMRMKGHGVLNPDLVGDLVRGFLGETPFALTWSREEYRNPIGVFSLARRRILELLHANSSVERYDREGF